MIFYVEDIPDDAELFVEVLDDLGYDCEVFNRADRLLESLDGASMLFLDIDLPVVSGIEILRNVRRDVRYKKLPVVMLSVSAHAITVKMARALGANLFLEKSKNFYAFRELIEIALKVDYEELVDEDLFLLKARV